MRPIDIVAALKAESAEAWEKVNKFTAKAQTLDAIISRYADEIMALREVCPHDVNLIIAAAFANGMTNKLELIKALRQAIHLDLLPAKDYVELWLANNTQKSE